MARSWIAAGLAAARRLAGREPAAWRELRRRLAAERDPRGVTRRERELARELRRLRQVILAATGRPGCCGRCAVGRPLPHGRFPGGFCCGAPTEELFTAEELCALALAGTTARQLRPRPALAGCLFRGPAGCALPPAHRPNVCVAHLCQDLQRELAAAGALDRVESLCLELRRLFDELCELRRQRRDRLWLERLGAPP
jgi:hypothetical protein